MSSILIKNGTLVTMDGRDSIVRGDLLIRDQRIAEIGGTGHTADIVIDAAGEVEKVVGGNECRTGQRVVELVDVLNVIA